LGLFKVDSTISECFFYRLNFENFYADGKQISTKIIAVKEAFLFIMITLSRLHLIKFFISIDQDCIRNS